MAAFIFVMMLYISRVYVAGPLGFGPAFQEGLRALYHIQETTWVSNSFSIGYCCDP